MSSRVLPVTSGDALVAEIAAAAGVAEAAVLPWRDALHDGPVPAGLAPDALARVRAGHLAARGWGTERAIRAALRERDARLAAHPPDAEVVLWFEDDLYDALQLALAAELVPLVAVVDGRYALTPEGAAVLAGEATRPRTDRWLGGVHLGPGRPDWA